MSNNPFVSVIIPVKELSYYLLFENLPAMAQQTYHDFEVLVMVNSHSQYDITLLKKYSWLRIIPTGEHSRPALKRNMGVEHAKGEIIAFIDDDAFPAIEWLQRAVTHFTEKGEFCITGPGVMPKFSTAFEEAVDFTLCSYLGSGPHRYRFIPHTGKYITDYPSMNFFIKKDLFESLNGFTQDYWPGEDSKLCEAIIGHGVPIRYEPDVLVYHRRRNSIGAYVRQQANYGYHRGLFMMQGDTNSRSFAYALPTLLVLYLVLWSIYNVLHFILPFPQVYFTIVSVPLLGYVMLTLYLGIDALVQTGRFQTAIFAILGLPLTHISYGVSFIRGIYTGLFSDEKHVVDGSKVALPKQSVYSGGEV